MIRITRRTFLRDAALLGAASLATAACGPLADAATVARSNRPRQTAPQVAPGDVQALTDGINAFALDLYAALRAGNGNRFFSPSSIAQVLTMILAGANGQTAQQLTTALHLNLPTARLHPAANALNLALLNNRPQDGSDQERLQLTLANDLWGQQGYRFQPAFLDLLAEDYGVGIALLDFQRQAEPSRATINKRVSDETQGKISELLPQGSITPDTRLVLTNAIYFYGKWLDPFKREQTRDGDFTPLGSSPVQVPLMSQTARLAYGVGDGYQAVSLPYHGDASLVVLLPTADQFASFEAGLNASRLNAILASMTPRTVELTLPKFAYRSNSFSLKQVLMTLGINDLFVAGTADLSGMDGTRNLYLSDGFHQATVTVDEAGTEAAAATGGVVSTTSAIMQDVQMTVDRPFICLIRDDTTGALLFVGRIVDPRA